MTAKEIVQRLNPNNSYWEMKEKTLTRLNDTPINANNVYIVFFCMSCDGDDGDDYHVIPYTDLKRDKEGDYLACCPEENVVEYDEFEEYAYGTTIPIELRELFETTKFEEW